MPGCKKKVAGTEVRYCSGLPLSCSMVLGLHKVNSFFLPQDSTTMMHCFTLSLSSGQPWTKTPETTHQNDFLLPSLSYLSQSLAHSATATSCTMAESQLKDSQILLQSSLMSCFWTTSLQKLCQEKENSSSLRENWLLYQFFQFIHEPLQIKFHTKTSDHNLKLFSTGLSESH